MRSQLADLRLLRSFVMVARLGAVTKAATALNLTQPALSQHLRELNQITGTALFEKHGRGIILTSAGSLLLEEVGPLLEQLDLSLQTIQARGEQVRGTLRIGAIASYSRTLVMPTVAKMLSVFPELFVTAVELTGAEIDRALLEGDIDVGISFSKTSAAGIDQRLLFEERLVLASASLSHDEIDLRELSSYPLALLNSQFAMRRQIDLSLASHGVVPDLRVEVDDVDALLRLAAIGPVSTIVGELAAGTASGVGIAQINDPGLVRSAAFRWRKGRMVKGAMGEFFDRLLSEIRSRGLNVIRN